MAVTLLQVLVLGAIAAAADDVPITWWLAHRAALPCVVADAEKIQEQLRRPPPPLEAEDQPRQMPYIWRKDNEEIKQSVDSSLDVSRKKDGDGVYQCAVRYHGGLVLGTPINLKFATVGKPFLVTPENATARAGQPFALTCDVTSGIAVDAWLRDNSPLPEDTRYHWTQMNNQLLITNVMKEDEGSYKCRVKVKETNSATKLKLSRPGKLVVVESDEDLKPEMLPLNKETNIDVPRGSRVVLPCPVVGWPKPKLKWEQHPPADRMRELEDQTEVIVLTSLEQDLEGTYTCSVEGNRDVIRTYNVTLAEKPVIILPPKTREVMRASTVRFNCTAVGNPAPTISWYKDGNPLDLTGRMTVLPAVNSKYLELLIRGVTSEDQGVYQCFASNTMGVTSAWAMLSVTGIKAAAPADVRCLPIGPNEVRVQWTALPLIVVAYSVQSSIPGGESLPGPPIQDTHRDIRMVKALTSARFQVRAFIRSPINNKTVASDMSESVTCQGQGVPIKLVKINDDHTLVSWQQFADSTPGVVKWMLQYRAENTSVEHNITLDGAVHNYTLKMSESMPLEIRVLGSRTPEWIPQDLSLIQWKSTIGARHLEDGGVTDIPTGVKITQLLARELTVRWSCDDPRTSLDPYTFRVCIKDLENKTTECLDSATHSLVVKNLKPNSNYEVKVQARLPGLADGGTFSDPVHITTPAAEGRIKNLTYKFVNDSVRVSWNSVPDKYKVHYRKVLKLPVEEWDYVEAQGNTVLIPGVDEKSDLYVMVAGYKPVSYSPILNIPARAPETRDLQYKFTSGGVQVFWSGIGTRTVRYSQDLTQSLDVWTTMNVTEDSVELTGLSGDLNTYVMVFPPGVSPSSRDVLTVPPRPPEEPPSLYLVISVCGSIIIVTLLLAAGVCIWRRRKLARSPSRRRRHFAAIEGTEEEGAEMQNIGGRLANGGGSKDAGEPLLNGHVHITVNPTSKTPNGRVRKGHRYEAAFDVSRYEDPDITVETHIDADTSASTTYNLLDTSRRPEYESRSSRDISANNSFSKLPDDNMNSELTRSVDFELDNSKILPTLQPNG